MQFTFVAACRCGTGLLPTQPHGYAVVPAFHIEWHNYMDVTFTHVDVRPTGVLPFRKNLDPINGRVQLRLDRVGRSDTDCMIAARTEVSELFRASIILKNKFCEFRISFL